MEWKEEAPKCPACGAASAAKALECAACGVVFEKWKLKARREEAPSGRSLEEPRPALVRDSDDSHRLIFKGAGAVMLLAAAVVAGWLTSGGSSRSSAPAFDAQRGYALTGPSGWRDVPDSGCGEPWGACVVRIMDRGDARPDRFLERLTLRVIPRGPDALSGAGRAELTGKLQDEIRAGIGEGQASPVAEAKFDGVAGFRVEGRGKKHFKIETAPAVVTNAQAALAEQQRLNPNKGVYSVMAAYNPHTLNPTVTLKEAEYAEFDARPVLGRIVVPTRDSLLMFSYQYDESSEASFTSGLDEALGSLRIYRRPRPMDGLGGALNFILFAAAAGLALTGLKLVLA